MSDQHDWMAGMTDFQRAEVARLESRIVSFEKRWQSLEADWNDCKKALATAMAELAATYSHQASSKSVLANVIAERDALRKRVAELEAQPAASDLRAEIDNLRSIVSILTCRVAALESAKFFGPHVPVNPWNPYPTTPWVIYGTRTSDRIEESA